MDDAAIDDILRQGHIPCHLQNEITNYIKTIPQFDWESFLFDCVSFLYGEECHIRIVSLDMAAEDFAKSYSSKPDELLARRIIKERYKAENAMLKAVSEGDADKALRYMANLKSTLPLEEYAGNDMRNGKNYTIVLCVLLRKAVEDGFVHPAHIHSVSVDFLYRIENAANAYDLIRLDELMVRRYCSLVKEFSLRDFSPFIRDILNHVDFNLQEHLTVASLAKQFKVSPGNLSTQFRREKGMPLTDYINVKRLERAKSMLCGTGLYIKEIADQCGFMDDNYFSRLFKRHFGISPKEFRQKITALQNL
jgi:AraC-like DNA-binding protein